MAIQLYRTVLPLEVVHADEWNALVNILAQHSNLHLVAKNSTTVAAVCSPAPRSVIAINGMWRWVEGEVEAGVPAGAEQTYDVLAVCPEANKFKAPEREGEGEHDETNYAFTLQVVTHGSGPSGTPYAWQKVGEVDWSGSAITAVRQLGGQVRSTDPIMPTMPVTTTPAVFEKGIASASAPIRKTEASAESNIVWQVLVGTTSKLKVLASGLVEWTSGLKLEAEGTMLKIAGKLKATGETVLEGGLTVVGALTLPGKSVTEAMLAEPAVGTSRLAELSVTTPKIAAQAVTEPKIGPHAVGLEQLSEGLGALVFTGRSGATINAANGELVHPTAASAVVKLPAAEVGHTVGVAVGSGSSATVEFTSGQIYGDALAATSVTLEERQHAIFRADGSNWAIIAGHPKGSIGSRELAAESVGTAQLAAKAVTSNKLAESLALAGAPTVPQAPHNSNSSQIANTAFVRAARGYEVFETSEASVTAQMGQLVIPSHAGGATVTLPIAGVEGGQTCAIFALVTTTVKAPEGGGVYTPGLGTSYTTEAVLEAGQAAIFYAAIAARVFIMMMVGGPIIEGVPAAESLLVGQGSGNAKWTASGAIKTAQLAKEAVTPEKLSMRLSWGVVGPSAEVLDSGSGDWSVALLTEGNQVYIYRVTWHPERQKAHYPVIVSSTEGNAVHVASAGTTTTYAEVVILNGSGTYEKAAFSFLAIGG